MPHNMNGVDTGSCICLIYLSEILNFLFFDLRAHFFFSFFLFSSFFVFFIVPSSSSLLSPHTDIRSLLTHSLMNHSLTHSSLTHTPTYHTHPHTHSLTHAAACGGPAEHRACAGTAAFCGLESERNLLCRSAEWLQHPLNKHPAQGTAEF